MILLVLFICLIIAVGAFAALAQTGMLPWSDPDRRSGPVLHMAELNQGCLISLIVASIVWFAAWGVVLVLSLRFLRSVI